MNSRGGVYHFRGGSTRKCFFRHLTHFLQKRGTSPPPHLGPTFKSIQYSPPPGALLSTWSVFYPLRQVSPSVLGHPSGGGSPAGFAGLILWKMGGGPILNSHQHTFLNATTRFGCLMPNENGYFFFKYSQHTNALCYVNGRNLWYSFLLFLWRGLKLSVKHELPSLLVLVYNCPDAG